MSTARSSSKSAAVSPVGDPPPRAPQGTQDRGDAQDESRGQPAASTRKRFRLWQGLWRAVVFVFAPIGRLIRDLWGDVYGKLLALLAAVLVAAAQGQTSLDPRTWNVSASDYFDSWRQNLPLEAGILGGLTLVVITSLLAERSRRRRKDEEQQQREINREINVEQKRAEVIGKELGATPTRGEYYP
jgi:hypothetical protein